MYYVNVTTDLTVNSRSLTAYRIGLDRVERATSDAPRGQLRNVRGEVYNNREHLTGYFDPLEAAVEAIHSEVHAPFTVWHDGHNGLYSVRSADAKPISDNLPPLRRIATSSAYALTWEATS
jgi:hypothetical protein